MKEKLKILELFGGTGADVLTAIAERINNKPKIMVSNSRIM